MDGAVAAALDLDVTGGEQDCLLTTWRSMFALRAVDVAQPDVCNLGGFTRTLRVAAMAALVQVVAGGLCGSDLNAIDGKRTLGPFPTVLGHEAAGVVVETRGRTNYCLTSGRAMAAGTLLDGTRRLSRDGGALHHRGCYFGSADAARDVPMLVERYLAGELLLDPLISRRVGLTGLDDAGRGPAPRRGRPHRRRPGLRAPALRRDRSDPGRAADAIQSGRGT
jgi:hypothetical protein